MLARFADSNLNWMTDMNLGRRILILTVVTVIGLLALPVIGIADRADPQLFAVIGFVFIWNGGLYMLSRVFADAHRDGQRDRDRYYAWKREWEEKLAKAGSTPP